MQKKTRFITRLGCDIKKNGILYVMAFPVVIYYIIFSYIPMAGVQLAFKEYNVKAGIWGSPWIGFENFRRFFSGYNCLQLIKNTLTISIYGLFSRFIIAIVFALLLDYIVSTKFKKAIQMVSYAPHFISTVVICGMLTIFMHPDTGIFNQVIRFFGGEGIAFLSKPEYFKHIYVWSGVWQGVGWSSIIYIAALSGVDYQLHEAAIMDGASIVKRIWHIDLPALKPTIMMLLILDMGQLMNVGFEKVFLLQNNLNIGASDVISTYVYRIGLVDADFEYSTAVGLFNSTINMLMVVSANFLSQKLVHESLW